MSIQPEQGRILTSTLVTSREVSMRSAFTIGRSHQGSLLLCLVFPEWANTWPTFRFATAHRTRRPKRRCEGACPVHWPALMRKRGEKVAADCLSSGSPRNARQFGVFGRHCRTLTATVTATGELAAPIRALSGF